MAIRRTDSATSSCVVRYDGLSLQVSCTEVEDLDWLTEFVRPPFRVYRRGSPAGNVHVTADTEEWKRLRRLGPDPTSRRRECVFLDTKIVRLPVWNVNRPGTALFDEEFNAFCLVDADRRAVNLVKTRQDRLARLALMRVVREFAINHLLHSSDIVVHGAAFVAGKRGVLVAGKKRSGKTSLLLHALHDRRLTYLSNDRVRLSLANDAPQIRGIPTIVNLRVSTLKQFPRLHDRLLSSAYSPVLSLRESETAPLGPARPWRKDQYSLSPIQLCRLLGVQARAEAPLDAILFPRVTGAECTIRLERMTASEAIRRLRESLFRSPYRRLSGSLFSIVGKGYVRSPDAFSQVLSTVASRIPCYVCHMGRTAFADASWLETLDL
ncbi:MAG: hypothetical protein JSW46_14620 [Gemmatimonadota bacterium]|nr:MAG: hypothetical protein JSW46_14620 [Gemmatimonadota bacterium]